MSAVRIPAVTDLVCILFTKMLSIIVAVVLVILVGLFIDGKKEKEKKQFNKF